MMNDERVDEVSRLAGALVLTALCVGLCAPALFAQRRANGVPAGTLVPITIGLTVGTEPFQLKGNGKCQHAPQASIYDVLAEQWSVQHSEGDRSLSLTMWRPKKGSGDMLTLSVNTGSRSHSITTVKAPNSGPTRGSGTISLASAAKGGTFTIEAATREGTRITGTIACGAFTAAVAEGGN